MKIGFFSESPADQAALAVFTEGILGQAPEIPSTDLEGHGVTGVINALNGVVRGMHYNSDADGLVVVVDCDDTELHTSAHDTSGVSDRCRLCQLRKIVARAASHSGRWRSPCTRQRNRHRADSWRGSPGRGPRRLPRRIRTAEYRRGKHRCPQPRHAARRRFGHSRRARPSWPARGAGRRAGLARLWPRRAALAAISIAFSRVLIECSFVGWSPGTLRRGARCRPLLPAVCAASWEIRYAPAGAGRRGVAGAAASESALERGQRPLPSPPSAPGWCRRWPWPKTATHPDCPDPERDSCRRWPAPLRQRSGLPGRNFVGLAASASVWVPVLPAARGPGRWLLRPGCVAGCREPVGTYNSVY